MRTLADRFRQGAPFFDRGLFLRSYLFTLMEHEVLWQRDGLNSSVQIIPDSQIEGCFLTRILLDDICNLSGHPVELTMCNAHLDELISLLRKARKAERKLEWDDYVASRQESEELQPAGALGSPLQP